MGLEWCQMFSLRITAFEFNTWHGFKVRSMIILPTYLPSEE